MEFKTVDGPIDQSWSMVRIATERPPLKWTDFFSRKDILQELSSLDIIFNKLEPFFPLRRNIFKVFNSLHIIPVG